MTISPQEARDQYVYYFEVDGVLTCPRQMETPEDYLRPGFYEQAPLQEEVVEWIRTILDEDYDIRFLTTYFPQREFSKSEKAHLLKKLFRDLELDGCVFLPFGESKAEYAKWNTVLVDPSVSSLQAWRNAGGLAIQALNREVHSDRVWDGAILDLSVPFDPEEILTRIQEKPRIAEPEHYQSLELLKKRQEEFVRPMKRKRRKS